ncbi:cytochrome c-type biogenesis protein CcmH [Colwellia sp. D2M02]|uniref:cytochrome c-type biogenesis protein n=1 Tax=Colwellia sp. D2M02 TaxID=2841562 RepID=UPI001C09EA48|nr:cytochrome c-type biogenesis protein [Colwellia sp. D2M02]MBU2894293.1 cytochrome c-type biogenesis protein CcmH [Colwellia sp. D2M02]
MLFKKTLIVLLTVVVYFCVSFSSSLSNQAYASPMDTYEFHDEVTKIRFQALTKELRCPKCQNQNLADSNSPIAADLRNEVYELLMQGKADIEIVDFMVKRYGEFVLYRPRVSQLTYVLWFGPAVLILFGAIVVTVIVRRKPVAEKDIQLNAEQQDKLKRFLKK